MFGVFFQQSIQGRDREHYRLDPTTSTQEQKYAVNRTLPVLKSGTVFADYLKWHFSISFPEEMVGLFDFLFELRSFLGVIYSKNRKWQKRMT